MVLNRRRFCLQMPAAVMFAAEAERVSRASDTTRYPTARDSEDVYTVWSVLIPIIQTQPGKGYMIAGEIAVPDALPYAATGEKKPPLQKAINAGTGKHAGYETSVPVQEMAAFTEALAEASQHQKDSVVNIERRLQLGKQYRVLSKIQMKAYLDLSPNASAVGWRADPRSLRDFMGWNEVSWLSLPFFSRSRELALVWASTKSGCTSTTWFFFKRIENGWVHLAWPTETRTFCA